MLLLERQSLELNRRIEFFYRNCLPKKLIRLFWDIRSAIEHSRSAIVCKTGTSAISSHPVSIPSSKTSCKSSRTQEPVSTASTAFSRSWYTLHLTWENRLVRAPKGINKSLGGLVFTLAKAEGLNNCDGGTPCYNVYTVLDDE